jgi:hypothetical protein
MFIVYCLELLLLVYLAPALALFPKLLLSSRTVVAIPFISIGIIVVVQSVLAATGGYSHFIVTGFSVILLLIAVARLALIFRGRDELMFYWPETHRWLLLFSLFLGIYWAAQLGSTSFDTDDEIYSWNLWAIQHYQNEAVDFYYTGSPYPQLFSILISYCYKLLGSIELQLPVKAMFAVFPIALWGAIAVAPKEASFANAIRSVVVMLLLFAALGKFFGVGLADPLMAASLVIAIFLFMQYTENPKHRELLVFSVVCGAVAFYTKQAGLIWALFSLPAIALIATWKRRLPPVTLVGAGVLLALGLIWVFGAGSEFHNNPGVVAASQEGRNTFEQLLFAIKKYCIEQPLVPLFLAAAAFGVLRVRRHRDILFLFLLPALVAWLLYGAYSLRLGIHVVAVSALLLAVSGYPLPAILGGGDMPRTERFMSRYALIFAVMVPVLIAAAAFYQVNKNLKIYGNQFSLYIAGKNTIARFFGKDAGFIFTELYDRPDLLLWVPSNYIYGVFYGHTPMMRPDLRKTPQYNVAMLLEDIKLRRPNYLFDGGQWVDYSIASGLLRELAEQQCSYLFERAVRRNKYGYVIYRLHNDDALIEQCGNSLQSRSVISP